MQTEIDKQIRIKIIMTIDEAKWLKNLVQNPINIKEFDKEPKKDADMRRLIWEALDNTEVV